jgi:hypothetical protein
MKDYRYGIEKLWPGEVMDSAFKRNLPEGFREYAKIEHVDPSTYYATLNGKPLHPTEAGGAGKARRVSVDDSRESWPWKILTRLQSIYSR